MNSSRALVSIRRVKAADADATSPIWLAAPWQFQPWVAVKFIPNGGIRIPVGQRKAVAGHQPDRAPSRAGRLQSISDRTYQAEGLLPVPVGHTEQVTREVVSAAA
jgi:hypothetical protein